MDINHVKTTQASLKHISRNTFFGLKKKELFFLLFMMILLFTMGGVVLPGQSLWLVLGLSFSVFILGHMYFTAERYVILPGITVYISCIFLIIAPWLSYSYKPSASYFSMSVPPDLYFSYAVPATIALWLGVHIASPFKWLAWNAPFIRTELSRRERRFLDILIVFGLITTHLSSYFPATLGFFFYLLSQLRFVAALSLMFSSTPGWWKRIALVYVHLLVLVSAGGVFFEFILWACYLLICAAYKRKWRMKLVLALAGTLFIMIVFNGVKGEYRNIISSINIGPVERVQLLGKLMVDSVMLHEDSIYILPIGDRLLRFNQGWIVSKVMRVVPDVVPYAWGDTIFTAIYSSLVPRLLVSDKVGIASKDMFYRFTGLQLSEDTSMALGISGEMYANFGILGGVLGVFVYGLIIGKLFSFFIKRAISNHLWWAWIPFVFLGVLEAEWNLVDILNYLIKALMVMIFLFIAFNKFKFRLFQY